MSTTLFVILLCVVLITTVIFKDRRPLTATGFYVHVAANLIVMGLIWLSPAQSNSVYRIGLTILLAVSLFKSYQRFKATKTRQLLKG